MKIHIGQPLSINELGNRDNQEDSLFPPDNTATANSRLFLLCDGMGGHEHGEVASRLVCTVLSDCLEKHLATGETMPDALLLDALDEVFAHIDQLADGSLRQMGTTLTMLCLHRGGATMAHIGDSRIYHIRPASQAMLYKSRDHTLVYDLFIAGEISRQEMEKHPRKNVITRAIMPGMERQPKLDIAHTTDIQPGDVFFLCSDGMLEKMGDADLLRLFATTGDMAELRQKLVGLTSGNADNHSAWLIRIESMAHEEDDGQLPHNENTVRCNALLIEQNTEGQHHSFFKRVKNWFS